MVATTGRSTHSVRGSRASSRTSKLTLTFSPNANMNFGPVRAGDAAGSAVPTAADPSGTLTIFQAVEKQLGLKLEMEKRTVPVIVIDHIEQKPTDN